MSMKEIDRIVKGTLLTIVFVGLFMMLILDMMNAIVGN